MKIKPVIALLAISIPAYLILNPVKKDIPSDLRDAVSDGAYNSLADSAPGAEAAAVPAPEPVETGDSKSIYGDDDRLDYYAAPASMKTLSNSVVSLWKSASVTTTGNKAALRVGNFGRSAGLCPGQKFAEQPIGAFCSGTLVGEDIVMTAGHCIVNQAACSNTKLVFGYALKKAGDYPDSVAAGDVYSCKSVIKRDLDDGSGFFHALVSIYNGGPGPDFALIKLDRKVTGRKPLAVNRNSRPAAGDKLFVIGHPVGLPLKVASSAKVRSASPTYFFTADLDTFGGNSGSAVFSARTNLIEGILVRGDVDFIDSPAGCKIASVVPQDGGRGESVTKISALEKFIP
ncbi:MAG: serine protease [Elusimicrobia bacterium CG_4_10_14_0_2_um_filter_56_8]|nr:MAG: serine protease [Elusimicrobia bacterium CG_4_10_14_0_2_um_filter_56_8]